MTDSEARRHAERIGAMRRALFDINAYGWTRPQGRLEELLDEYEGHVLEGCRCGSLEEVLAGGVRPPHE